MVYLIVCDETNACKIGVSNGNVWRRLSHIQCGSPFDLRLHAVIDGDFNLEKALHSSFAEHSISREWFRFDIEIRNFFEKNSIPLDSVKDVSLNKYPDYPKRMTQAESDACQILVNAMRNKHIYTPLLINRLKTICKVK